MKTIENSRHILRKALETYGGDKQTWKCQEEIGEYLQAIGRLKNSAEITAITANAGGGMQVKFFDQEKINEIYRNLTEEIADCIIMLEQMKMLYGVDQVNAWIHYKLDRLEQRMKKTEDTPTP